MIQQFYILEKLWNENKNIEKPLKEIQNIWEQEKLFVSIYFKD